MSSTASAPSTPRPAHPDRSPSLASPPRAADQLRHWCDRHRRWLLLIVLLLYCASFNGQWRISTDSAEHAIAAVRMLEPDRFAEKYNAIRVEPGVTWLMALEFKMLGVGSFTLSTVVMFLLGLIGLASCHVWIRLHADRATAVVVTCLLGVNFCYYQYVYTLRADLPFVVGLLCFLAGYELFERRDLSRMQWLGLAWMVAGVAMMAVFRSVVLLFFAAAGLAMLWQLVRGPERKRSAIVVSAAMVCIGLFRWADPRLSHPLQLNHDEMVFLHNMTEGWRTVIQRIAHENLAQLMRIAIPDAAFGVELKQILGEPLSLLMIAFIVALWRRRPFWVLLPVVFVVVQLLPFDALTRYLLPLVPLMALAWWLGACWMNRRLPEPWAGRVFVVMLLLWLVPNMIQVTRHIIEQRRTPFMEHYKDGRYIAVQEFGEAIARTVEPNALVLTDDRRGELSWYAGRQINASYRHRDPSFWQQRTPDDPVYLVGPTGNLTAALIEDVPLRVDEPIITVQRPGEDEPLTLQRAWPYEPVDEPVDEAVE